MSICLELVHQKVRRDKTWDGAVNLQPISVEMARLAALSNHSVPAKSSNSTSCTSLGRTCICLAVIAASPHLLLERALSQELDVSCTTARFDFSSLLSSPCGLCPQVLGNTRRTSLFAEPGHSPVFTPRLLSTEHDTPEAHCYCALTTVPYDFTDPHDVTNLLHNPAEHTTFFLDAATRVTVTRRHHARGTSVEPAQSLLGHVRPEL